MDGTTNSLARRAGNRASSDCERSVIICIMKRIGGLWHRVVSAENLLAAYYMARQGKQQRNDVALFSLNLEPEIFTLQDELLGGLYVPGEYRQFIIRERKRRLISAAPFRDRVVHHAIMNVLDPILDNRFYYHSYACRKAKGVHRAVNYYQQCSQRYAYVLKLDIARYFPSIVHEVLKSQLRRVFKDKQLLALIDLIIDKSPGQELGVGLPIGNLTSQYFANMYLNDVDHWLCRQSEASAYLRYVDDLMLFADSKSKLWDLKNRLKQRLFKIGLQLHDKKQQLMRCSERVDVWVIPLAHVGVGYVMIMVTGFNVS